jgi:hypothetical protein
MAASSESVQTNIDAEQTKLNSRMSLFKAYPILSGGLGYKF